jgi:hypothetical protein
MDFLRGRYVGQFLVNIKVVTAIGIIQVSLKNSVRFADLEIFFFT